MRDISDDEGCRAGEAAVRGVLDAAAPATLVPGCDGDAAGGEGGEELEVAVDVVVVAVDEDEFCERGGGGWGPLLHVDGVVVLELEGELFDFDVGVGVGHGEDRGVGGFCLEVWIRLDIWTVRLLNELLEKVQVRGREVELHWDKGRCGLTTLSWQPRFTCDVM